MAKKNIDKYLNWFAKYVGIQGILTMGFFLVFCIMTVRGMEINPEFYGILGIIIGFYFAKNGKEIVDQVRGNGKDH